MPNRDDLSDYNQALDAGMPPIRDESVEGGAMVSDRERDTDTANAPVHNYREAEESDDDDDTNDDDYESTHNFGGFIFDFL